MSETDFSEFVEVDPTGRYGRYNEILGKGASKTVYRAFDEYEGIEVAWNQVKLYDFLQKPEDLERLYCEIHLLKTLKHNNIMKFYISWVDTANRNINFVTEMFTSGTLRQYRLKHRRVDIRAVKQWCRQILQGLLYLHSHEPPVIHRDLKCDNIFINGNLGQVKIGDLGLAAILQKSQAARCVGTPEFMAPEVYAEEYNELVDIYSFGMCILEIVTFEYPYSECTNPAQIYKKVTSGKRPDALYRVRDPELRQFVEKCLATASCRLSAEELLKDPFLRIDGYGSDSTLIEYNGDFDELGLFLRQPPLINHHSTSSLANGCSNYVGCGPWNDLDYSLNEFEANKIDLFNGQDYEHLANLDITISGRREDDSIFLRLRMEDKEGHVRNIYFNFDVEIDTAISVATEMVAELGISDQDVTRIADMIDDEIASLVPEWERGPQTEENAGYKNTSSSHNCASIVSPEEYLSSKAKNPQQQILHCSENGALHGRFEEIVYKFEELEQSITEDAPPASSPSDGIQYIELSSERSREIPSHDEQDEKSKSENDEGAIRMKKSKSYAKNSPSVNEIRQELRWLRAKYQMQLRELRDRQLGLLSPPSNKREQKGKEGSNDETRKSFGHFSSYYPANEGKHSSNRRTCNHEAAYGTYSPGQKLTAKSFYAGTLMPRSLHRATSLPDHADF